MFSSHLKFLLCAMCCAAPLLAQNPAPIAAEGATMAEPVGANVQKRLVEGQSLLADGDARALPILREATQMAFQSLNQAIGRDVLAGKTANLPDDNVTISLANRAAQASFFWGMAAKKFARRDEAITAFARGQRVTNALPAAKVNGRLATDLNGELSAITRSGMPLVAPDDVLETLSHNTRNDRDTPLWKPLKWSFNPSPLSATIGGPALSARELLITQGQIFKGFGADKKLFAVPALYAGLPEASLPPTLQPNQLVLGYARETSGPNAGQWRLIVRVYFAASVLTQGRRNDRPRAEKLARQFLQAHAIFNGALGLSNLYTRGQQDQNVTTLWLLEVSSLWPLDDSDPLVQSALGPLMPQINTGPRTQNLTEPVRDPLRSTWAPVAAQDENAPGEIIFWRAGLERPEASWLSTLFHEYGHVALPAFGGFRPPLEPYGNGVMGETLGMMMAASAPAQFGVSLQDKPGGSAFLTTDFTSHLNSYAVPALQNFLKNGPNWRLKNEGTAQALQFLNGAAVFVERVYGAEFLGQAFGPLSRRTAAAQNIAERRSLLISADFFDALTRANEGSWKGKIWPIWLAGATNAKIDAATLLGRGEVTLQHAQTLTVTLWVPNGAQSLLIDGGGAEKLRAVGLPFKNERGATRVFFAGKQGWQSFGLSASGVVRLGNAVLERN